VGYFLYLTVALSLIVMQFGQVTVQWFTKETAPPYYQNQYAQLSAYADQASDAIRQAALLGHAPQIPSTVDLDETACEGMAMVTPATPLHFIQPGWAKGQSLSNIFAKAQDGENPLFVFAPPKTFSKPYNNWESMWVMHAGELQRLSGTGPISMQVTAPVAQAIPEGYVVVLRRPIG
jgi:hypothetical protein